MRRIWARNSTGSASSTYFHMSYMPTSRPRISSHDQRPKKEIPKQTKCYHCRCCYRCWSLRSCTNSYPLIDGLVPIPASEPMLPTTVVLTISISRESNTNVVAIALKRSVIYAIRKRRRSLYLAVCATVVDLIWSGAPGSGAGAALVSFSQNVC
jgi:hypothetical protein